MRRSPYCIKLVAHESPLVNRFLVALLVGNFVLNVFDAMTTPFLALLFTRQHGLGTAEAGLLVGMVVLTGTLFALPGGALADRFGALRMGFLGFVLNVFGLVGLAHADTLASIAGFAGMLALGRAFYMPSTLALLTLLAGPGHELRMRGYRYMATNVGFSVGPLLGAALDIAGNTKGFLIAAGFNVLALAFLATSAASLLRRGERADVFRKPLEGVGAHTVSEAAHNPPTKERVSIWDGLRPRFMKWHVVGAFVTAVAYAQHQSTLSQSLVAREDEAGLSLYALLMTINGVTAVAFQIPMNALSRRVGLRMGLVAGHLCYVLGFLGFALPTGRAWMPCLAMFVFTLGEVLCVLNVGAVPIFASGASDRGRYLGAAQLAQAGGGLGPMLGGVLLAALGVRDVWFAVAGLVLLALLFHLESLRALAQSPHSSSHSPFPIHLKESRRMTTPRQTVTRFFERVRSGKAPEEASLFLAPRVAAHQVVSAFGPLTLVRTPDEYAAHVRDMIHQYGLFTLTIEDVLADGNKVFVRWRQEGHHRGPLFGEPPTGAPLVQRGSAVYRVEEERIEEYWIQVEVSGLETQIAAARAVGTG